MYAKKCAVHGIIEAWRLGLQTPLATCIIIINFHLGQFLGASASNLWPLYAHITSEGLSQRRKETKR